MKSTRKEIRGLDETVLDVIEKRAQELNITSNQLIKDVINDYAARLQEVEASNVLHAHIDDLIEANNDLVNTQNQNTLIIGELTKIIIERLDYYLPENSDNNTSNSRKTEKSKG